MNTDLEVTVEVPHLDGQVVKGPGVFAVRGGRSRFARFAEGFR